MCGPGDSHVSGFSPAFSPLIFYYPGRIGIPNHQNSMTDVGILRADKDSSAIIFPVFGADLCRYWTLLKQSNKRLVRNVFNHSIAFTCLCDFILGIANLRTDFSERIIGEGSLIGDASFGYKLQCVCNKTAIAIAPFGT
jgi:hypothetical protein